MFGKIALAKAKKEFVHPRECSSQPERPTKSEASKIMMQIGLVKKRKPWKIHFGNGNTYLLG